MRILLAKGTSSSNLYAPNSNSCISTPIENWTHVYMNLFTRNSPYYHLLKYLLFLLKHPVYFHLKYLRQTNHIPLDGREMLCELCRSTVQSMATVRKL